MIIHIFKSFFSSNKIVEIQKQIQHLTKSNYNNSYVKYVNPIFSTQIPLICIQGYLCPKGDSAKVIANFKNKYIYSYQLPNHYDNNRYTSIMNDKIMTQDFANFINSIKINQFFLLGYSMGGRVAINYCLQNKQKVKGLICFEPAVGKIQYPAYDYFLQILWKLNNSNCSKENYSQTLKSFFKPLVDQSWQFQNQFIQQIVPQLIYFDKFQKLNFKFNFGVLYKFLYEQYQPIFNGQTKKYHGPTLLTYGGQSTMKLEIQKIKKLFPSLNKGQNIIKFDEYNHGGPVYHDQSHIFAEKVNEFINCHILK